MGNFQHLTMSERITLEYMHNRLRQSPRSIAAELGKHPSTIYREIKRGLCEQKDSEWRIYEAYSAQLAQMRYEENAQTKGARLKIGKDHDLAAFIETMIADEKYSPAAVLGKIQDDGLQFSVTLSHATLYRYIDDNLFLRITNKDLPLGKRPKKQKYDKVRRISYQQPLEPSIDDRPEYIANRDEFGHWEMDTVVGKAKGKSTCLLVLTERMTRFELVYKIQQKSARCVVRALDKIERRFDGAFSDVFKSIATDNGCEFSDGNGIRKKGRTILYKCHPYSSWERGSNENANKLIRRFIPKGTDISKYTHKEIERIEHWMNNYPRRILGYTTSKKLFDAEVAKLAATAA